MANDPQAPAEALTAAAEAVREQLRVPAFNAAAVAVLAQFVEGQRQPLSAAPAAERQGIITALGCFLGECLVRTYGAEWAAGPDGTTGVGLGGRLFFNPFYLVDQQLQQGEKASVAAFFSSVPARLAAKATARKGWIS